METNVIFIYCLSEAILSSLSIKDDPQSKMNNAEILTFVLISALYYQCNYKNTRQAAISYRYFPKILSLSRLNRRIHKIPQHIWVIIFKICRDLIKNENNKEYIIDSFPIAAFQNYKRFRCKLFSGKEFHGYTASKKQYFFGLKVHVIVDIYGVPIEFVFTPGGESDIRGMRRLELELSEGSEIFADSAYTDYALEDFLAECPKIKLIAKRKRNSKRTHSCYDNLRLSIKRNKIETTFSNIQSLMPRWIRARTERGFCLKIMFFILGYTVKLNYA